MMESNTPFQPTQPVEEENFDIFGSEDESEEDTQDQEVSLFRYMIIL